MSSSTKGPYTSSSLPTNLGTECRNLTSFVVCGLSGTSLGFSSALVVCALPAKAGDVYAIDAGNGNFKVVTVCKNGFLFIVAASARGIDIEQVYSANHAGKSSIPVICKVKK